MFLLDTNVVSELRHRPPDPRVASWYSKVETSAMFISVLTLGEIKCGADRLSRKDPDRHRAIMRWLDLLQDIYRERVFDVDRTVAMAWGYLNAARTRPVVDGLLAATALVHDLTLVTRNVRDFAGTNVPVINPWEP